MGSLTCRTLLGAVAAHLGGALHGPSGAGKTEMVCDVALTLGRQCVVRSCSPATDCAAMAMLLKVRLRIKASTVAWQLPSSCGCRVKSVITCAPDRRAPLRQTRPTSKLQLPCCTWHRHRQCRCTSQSLGSTLATCCHKMEAKSSKASEVDIAVQGLAASGAWVCLDDFDRVKVEVLSVVAQQLQELQAAMHSKAATFALEGSEVPLRRTCAAFATLSPGYAGRSELPGNVQALFRLVRFLSADFSELVWYMPSFQCCIAGWTGIHTLARHAEGVSHTWPNSHTCAMLTHKTVLRHRPGQYGSHPFIDRAVKMEHARYAGCNEGG